MTDDKPRMGWIAALLRKVFGLHPKRRQNMAGVWYPHEDGSW